MDRHAETLVAAQRALATLREALAIASPTLLERDGTIQRFEYTFEAVCKAAQRYLLRVEKMAANSPRAAFRGLGKVGLLSEAEVLTALAMADDRNRTVHTYVASVAEAIMARIPGHAALLGRILATIERTE